MPKLNVQCEANITPSQLAAMVCNLSTEEMLEFWTATIETMRYAPEDRLRVVFDETERMASRLSILIANRAFVQRLS